MDEASAIVEDFRWLPFRFDPITSSISFVLADRAAHRAVTFLDDQLLEQSAERRQTPLTAVTAAQDRMPGGECHFIFHSAFCCSTLLARAFDVPGKAMSLKEPVILNDMVQAAFAAGRLDVVRDSLGLVLALLGRPFGPGEQVIVKPSNAANPLIGEMLSARTGSKTVFLSSALPDFLRSVAKKGLFGRVWARRQMASFDRLPQLNFAFTQAERWEHSDLQVAALVWLHQRAQFSKLIRELPAERAASLDSADLLAAPEQALAAVSGFLGTGLSPEQVRDIANGPVFASDAKRHDRSFDPGRREAEHQAINDLVGEEIAMVASWGEALAGSAGLAMELPRSLYSSPSS